MIKAGKRNAVYLLHQEGMGLRQIARHLHMSVNTVKTIVEQKGHMPETIRKDKIRIDPELLARLYHECQGRVQRIHEKLIEVYFTPNVKQFLAGVCGSWKPGIQAFDILLRTHISQCRVHPFLIIKLNEP